MAAGLPSAVTVEIELTAGVWTDISADVMGQPGITIRQGRSSQFDTVQAGTCSFTVENIPDASGICKYTPDNPLSSFFPNLVEGKRVSVAVTKSATGYGRFNGYITSIAPVFGDELNTASVVITAVDLLGVYGGITMISDYAAQILAGNPTNGADVFPFTEKTGAASCANLGRTSGNTGPAATIVQPGRGSTITFGTDQTLNVDGIFTTTANNPGVGVTSATSFGPILLLNCNYPMRVGFWMKTTVSGSGPYHLLGGTFDPTPYISLVANGPDLSPSFFGRVGVFGTVVNDGAWHYYEIIGDGFGSWNCSVDHVIIDTATSAVTGGPGVCWLGGMYTNRQSSGYCLPSAAWAGWFLEYDVNLTDYRVFALPNQTVTGYDRLAELATHSPSGIVPLETGTDTRVVIRKPTVGVNLLAAIAELAATLGVPIFCDGDLLRIRVGLANRSTTVIASIALESDDDASGGFSTVRDAGSIPTRVTVTSPLGDVTVINAAAEINGVQRATSLTTTSASLLDAADAGNAELYQNSKLRISGISVDLSTALNSLYSALLTALVPGARIRVTNVPSGAFGFTYLDVYVQGWTETITATGYVITFDTTPADAPPDGIFDDATYGRFASDGATVTGGTCVGNTSTGTVIVTTTNGSSPAFTAAGGDYPMDMDWNGERITVSGVGGSTSPQTFTVTARGVAPTVARAHATGEKVDVYLAACFAF